MWNFMFDWTPSTITDNQDVLVINFIGLNIHQIKLYRFQRLWSQCTIIEIKMNQWVYLIIPQGPDLVSFLHWSTSPCTILLAAFLATLVSVEPTLMLELWTLLPAMARLAPITIGSYISRSPKLICAKSKLILATSTSKYRKTAWEKHWGDGKRAGNEIWAFG